MSLSNLAKIQIENQFIHKLEKMDFIVSATIVGSFHEKTIIQAISDIDLVVIVDSLTEKKFQSINDSVLSISPSDINLSEYQIKINNTFGPLKLNSDNVIVFHVMIYDIESHKEHVEKSPFTCFDWERFCPLIGKSLNEIYPVGCIQLSDLLTSRRGLHSYFSDIKLGVISYRKYSFLEDSVSITQDNFQLDERHKNEYCYHVVKYLLINLHKILRQHNQKVELEELVKYSSDMMAAFPLSEIVQ